MGRWDEDRRPPVPAHTLPCSRRRCPSPPPLPASLQDLPSLHIKTRDYTHIDGRCAKVPAGAAALVQGTAAPARGVLALPPARLTPSVPLLPQNRAPAAGGGHGADVVPSKNGKSNCGRESVRASCTAQLRSR